MISVVDNVLRVRYELTSSRLHLTIINKLRPNLFLRERESVFSLLRQEADRREVILLVFIVANLSQLEEDGCAVCVLLNGAQMTSLSACQQRRANDKQAGSELARSVVAVDGLPCSLARNDEPLHWSGVA